MRYGAPVGYIEEGGKDSRCLVAIRNMQWKDNWIGLGAGCGIVPESRLDLEWEELQLKIQSIKEILGL